MLSDLRRRTTGLLDLFLRCLREAMGRDLQSLRKIPVPKNDEIVLRLLDQAAIVEDLRRDLIARLEVILDLRKADLEPLLLKDIRKTTLRKTTLKRHLSAFKTRTARITRTRLLTLVSAAGRLSESRTGTAANALLLMRRTGSRM